MASDADHLLAYRLATCALLSRSVCVVARSSLRAVSFWRRLWEWPVWYPVAVEVTFLDEGPGRREPKAAPAGVRV